MHLNIKFGAWGFWVRWGGPSISGTQIDAPFYDLPVGEGKVGGGGRGGAAACVASGKNQASLNIMSFMFTCLPDMLCLPALCPLCLPCLPHADTAASCLYAACLHCFSVSLPPILSCMCRYAITWEGIACITLERRKAGRGCAEAVS